MNMTIHGGHAARGARLLTLLAFFGTLLFSGDPAHPAAAACIPVVPTINGFVVPNAPPTCAEETNDPVATGDADDPDMPAMPADPADPADPTDPDAPATPEDGGEE